MNALEELRKHTIVVADSGEWKQFLDFHPTDATTNPTLVLQAASTTTAESDIEYKTIVETVIKHAKALPPSTSHAERVCFALTEVNVAWGIEILKHVTGRVSTEVDARLSFDTEGTITKAREIIKMYNQAGISTSRVLVKIAATWEGINACKVLENEGIHCNLTLIFSLYQAILCAEAGATVISPFVGRISDFFKEKNGGKLSSANPSDDPGVVSVRTIYTYFKQHGFKTSVMGASFRSKEQVLELTGCDLLTISPKLLADLKSSPSSLAQQPRLSTEIANMAPKQQDLHLDEKTFRHLINMDEMASFKLSEGIRKFCLDIITLEQRLSTLLS